MSRSLGYIRRTAGEPEDPTPNLQRQRGWKKQGIALTALVGAFLDLVAVIEKEIQDSQRGAQ